MIFFDTETTGLVNAKASKLEYQPHITEICMIKMDGAINEQVDMFNQLVKPPIPISEEITKITGITNEMLADKPTFVDIFDDLVEFVLGEYSIVGHNINFDMDMLWIETMRMGMTYHFPWPPEWICTVEKSMTIENKRLRLAQLHTYATGHEHVGAHRAINDVQALITCYKYLHKKELV